MNIRKLTVAAIIALAASSASFAQRFETGDAIGTSSNLPSIRVLMFGNTDVTVSKAILDVGDLSEKIDLSSNASVDVSKQFKVVSVKNADCYNVTLSRATLQSNDGIGSAARAEFEFNVSYARGTDSGIDLVTVTLENLQTHTQFDVEFQASLI